MTEDKRNSGATLYTDVVVKVGVDLRKQAAVMKEYPATFCEVLLDCGDYYIMPRKVPFSVTTPREVVVSALGKLKTFWGATPFPSPRPQELLYQREEYYDYCISRLDGGAGAETISEVLTNLYKHIGGYTAGCVYRVHGDATLQNIVWDAETLEAYWIDPNPRFVPSECFVDYGKLLQSLEGYDNFGVSQVQDITAELDNLNPSAKIITYFYLVSHLARLYPYQDNVTKDWAVSVAERYAHI